MYMTKYKEIFPILLLNFTTQDKYGPHPSYLGRKTNYLPNVFLVPENFQHKLINVEDKLNYLVWIWNEYHTQMGPNF